MNGATPSSRRPAGSDLRELAFPPSADGHILGVGIDVVDIARLTDRFGRSPALVDRLLCPEERDLSAASRAARVAAKEAVGKALGTPGDFSWHDVTVRRTELGRPYPVLRGAALGQARRLGVGRLHLSLSHDGALATAIVIAERGPCASPAAPADAGHEEPDGGADGGGPGPGTDDGGAAR